LNLGRHVRGFPSHGGADRNLGFVKIDAAFERMFLTTNLEGNLLTLHSCYEGSRCFGVVRLRGLFGMAA